MTPTFLNWHFMADRGEGIAKYWKRIPDNVDILITHGPCYGILDVVPVSRFNNKPKNVGCEELLKAVKRVKPLYHIFGHIHDSYGNKKIEDTTFMNVSVVNEDYRVVNLPTVIDYA